MVDKSTQLKNNESAEAVEFDVIEDGEQLKIKRSKKKNSIHMQTTRSQLISHDDSSNNNTIDLLSKSPTDFKMQQKVLVFPSMLCTVFFACNQFMISLVSNEGIHVAYSFFFFLGPSAIVLKTVKRWYDKRHGVKSSKVFIRNGKINWVAVVAMILRTTLNAFIIVCWVIGY